MRERFLQSDDCRKMADRTSAIGTDDVEWLARDHGSIVWPPEPSAEGESTDR